MTTAFKTDELRWLVLDEADRLLDMGFQQKIGTVPNSNIVQQSMNYLRKTITTTIITANTQCRMLLPIVITTATIYKLRRYINSVRYDTPSESTHLVSPL